MSTVFNTYGQNNIMANSKCLLDLPLACNLTDYAGNEWSSSDVVTFESSEGLLVASATTSLVTESHRTSINYRSFSLSVKLRVLDLDKHFKSILQPTMTLALVDNKICLPVEGINFDYEITEINKWYDIKITRNEDNDNISLYVDGDLKETIELGLNVDKSPCCIGSGSKTEIDDYFVGVIKDLKLFVNTTSLFPVALPNNITGYYQSRQGSTFYYRIRFEETTDTWSTNNVTVIFEFSSSASYDDVFEKVTTTFDDSNRLFSESLLTQIADDMLARFKTTADTYLGTVSVPYDIINSYKAINGLVYYYNTTYSLSDNYSFGSNRVTIRTMYGLTENEYNVLFEQKVFTIDESNYSTYYETILNFVMSESNGQIARLKSFLDTLIGSVSIPEPKVTRLETSFVDVPEMFVKTSYEFFDTISPLLDDNGHRWISEGNPLVGPNDAKFVNAVQLNGKTQNMQMNQDTLELGGSDFTIDYWQTSLSGKNNSVKLFKGLIYFNNGSSDLIEVRIDDQLLHYFYYGAGKDNFVEFADDRLVFNKPVHVAIVYKHEEATVSLFYNGKLIVTKDNVSIERDYYHIRIDGDGISTIEELRISDNARWTNDFALPKSDYQEDGNTLSLLHFDSFPTSFSIACTSIYGPSTDKYYDTYKENEIIEITAANYADYQSVLTQVHERHIEAIKQSATYQLFTLTNPGNIVGIYETTTTNKEYKYRITYQLTDAAYNDGFNKYVDVTCKIYYGTVAATELFSTKYCSLTVYDNTANVSALLANIGNTELENLKAYLNKYIGTLELPQTESFNQVAANGSTIYYRTIYELLESTDFESKIRIITEYGFTSKYTIFERNELTVTSANYKTFVNDCKNIGAQQRARFTETFFSDSAEPFECEVPEDVDGYFESSIGELYYYNIKYVKGTPTNTICPVTINLKYKQSSIVDDSSDTSWIIEGLPITDEETYKIGTRSLSLKDKSCLQSINYGSFNFNSTFTMEAWIYPNEEFNKHGDKSVFPIFSRAYDDTKCLYSFEVIDNKLVFSSDYPTKFELKSTNEVIKANQWQHVAVVKDSSNVVRLFYDGAVVGSSTLSNNLSSDNGRGLLIGASFNNSYYSNGFMDEIRISNNARWTTMFVPSTSVYSMDSSTLALLHFDESNKLSDYYTYDIGITGANYAASIDNCQQIANDALSKLKTTINTTTIGPVTFDPAQYVGTYVASNGITYRYKVVFSKVSEKQGICIANIAVLYDTSTAYSNTMYSVDYEINYQNYSTYMEDLIDMAYRKVIELKQELDSYVCTVTIPSNTTGSYTSKTTGNLYYYQTEYEDTTYYEYQKYQADISIRTSYGTVDGNYDTVASFSNYVVLPGNRWSYTGSMSLLQGGSFDKRLFTSKAIGVDSTNYIQCSAPITLGGTDFTIDYWVYCTGIGTFFSLGAGTTGVSQGFYTGFETYTPGHNVDVGIPFANNALNHVALVYTHVDGKWKTFVNGKLLGTIVNQIEATTFNDLTIGGSYRNGGSVIMIDDFHIRLGVAKWNKNFKPALQQTSKESTSAVLLSSTSGVIMDSCFNSWSITGSPVISTSTVKFGTSAQFNSSGVIKKDDTVTIGGNEDFTVDFWTYVSSDSAANGMVFSLNADYTSDGVGHIYFGRKNEEKKLCIGFGTEESIVIPDTVTDKMYHVAIVYQAPSTVKVFIDGVCKYNNNNIHLNDQSRTVTLGGYYNDNYTGEFRISGTLDEFRISKVARWVDDFSVPKAQYSVDSNTLVLLHFDETLVRDEVGNNCSTYSTDCRTLGNAQVVALVEMLETLSSEDEPPKVTRIYL